MSNTEFQSRLQVVRSHYRVTPWIRPREDESPLLRSWQRCRDAGIREADRVQFELVSRASLAELDDRHGALVRLARPELQRLGHALSGSGCAVLLFNPHGMVIDRHCHDSAAPDALRVTTRVGMNVAERCVGTTAPAIALAEGEPYLVGRDAHFCANVRPFFCVAAPIHDPGGRRVGALDITYFDDVPGFDVFSLVVDAAAAIENRLFVPDRERLLVRFHVRPELVDTPLACLLQVDAEGRVGGANRAAEQLLCAARSALLGRPFESLFDRATRHLFGAGPSARHGRLVEMRSHAGLHVWASFGGADLAPAQPSLHERELQAMDAVPAAPAEPAAPASLRELECRTIEQTLAELDGNVAATARRLGVSRNTIYRRMAERREG